MYIEITDRPDHRNVLTAVVKPSGFKVLSASLETFNTKVIVTVELEKELHHARENHEAAQDTCGPELEGAGGSPRAWG